MAKTAQWCDSTSRPIEAVRAQSRNPIESVNAKDNFRGLVRRLIGAGGLPKSTGE